MKCDGRISKRAIAILMAMLTAGSSLPASTAAAEEFAELPETVQEEFMEIDQEYEETAEIIDEDCMEAEEVIESLSGEDVLEEDELIIETMEEIPAVSYEENVGEDVEINDTNFRDAAFRDYISKSIDTDHNGILTETECNQVISLDIYGEGITTLMGIQFFQNLTELYCSENKITELDVSKNTDLIKLYCSDNAITELDVSKNTNLRELYCSGNEITELDVSKNTYLRELDCSGNEIAELDVSGNTNLRELYCSGNEITELDVSGNTNLRELYCSGNEITELDVSMNPNLEVLECRGNELTELNVSKNTNLQVLDFGKNKLTELDISQNKDLLQLDCDDNRLTALDASQHGELIGLRCQGNKELSELNVDACIELRQLWFENTKIEQINLSTNTGLKQISCYETGLKTLDLSHNTLLYDIRCYGNELEELNLEKNTNLSSLYCSDNKLTKLDVSQNSLLLVLNISQNSITELDFSNNPSLYELDCSNNKITKLDLNTCESLTKVNLHNQTIDPGITVPVDSYDMRAFFTEDELNNLSWSQLPTGVTYNNGVLHFYGEERTVNLTCDYLTNAKYAGDEKWNLTVSFQLPVLAKECSHTYGEWQTETAATYEEPEHQKRICTVCGAVETRTVGEKLQDTVIQGCDKTGLHTYGEWQTETAATYLETERQKRTCSICGATETRTFGEKLQQATVTLQCGKNSYTISEDGAINIPVSKNQKITLTFAGADSFVGNTIAYSNGNQIRTITQSNPKSGNLVQTGNTVTYTAKGTGSNTVTFKLTNGQELKYTFAGQKKAVTTKSIQVNAGKTITLKKGKSFALKTSLTPVTSVDKVKYTSKKTKVATVSKSGVIKGKKKGKSTITVAAGKKKVKIQVVVQ